MAQRIAVLLAVASILIIACAADEPAAAYKYEKKGHVKHTEKYDKEYKPEHKEYKPEYKEYKPEHKEYKPEGYYKPDGYKPDYHKPGYGGKEYEHYGEHAYPPAPYGGYSDMHKSYEPEYAHPTYGYESYGEPSPYDGGYWGGLNGRQIIHLQAVYPENIINSSLVQPGSRRADIPVDPCKPSDLDFCTDDFSVICAKRHYEYSNSYSNGGDYNSGKYGPIFQTDPATPVAIGKGNVQLEFFEGSPLAGINLVTFNKHQVGYKIGDVNGFIGNFIQSAKDCHPLLGPDTTIEFFSHQVPVYLIFGKVKLPVDPAILLPLGGFYVDERNAAKTQGVDKSDEYTKTTPEGNKYKLTKEMAYVYNDKDDTYCGVSVVAKGAVTVVWDPAGSDNTATYTGTLEWPILWTDLITTLPLLVDDDVDTRQASKTILPFILPVFDLATVVVEYVEAVLDRVAHVCKSNSDIPWITPGSITLDVTRVPSQP